MRILETIKEEDNFGNMNEKVIERNVPDTMPSLPNGGVVHTQPYVTLLKDEPVSGKLYYVRFNTTREIQVETPKNLTIGGWGIIIEKVFKPTPETLKVVFSIQTGVEKKTEILKTLV
jgi:hypothetical protein